MKSLDELRKIRDEVKKSMEMRSSGQTRKIIIGMGTCGIAAGARETMRAFMDALDKADVAGVAVTATGCVGFCDKEPLVEVEVQGQKPVRYGKVDKAAAERIVAEHIVGGKVVGSLVI